ncbi:MAG TPA: type I DNA topoisomerase [Deltaproteobacteria bacterium]|nr:MAG: DNA topoisomerase I [Deltaproteobacteria bacterium GWA2_45_12]HBF12873.1 type I DNA topoisomerase [Deltaproteobacteria bacterium]
MSKINLVIVESPAKAKTIEKYLGKNFRVRASIGHIKDLPTKKLGVDIEHNFKPQYEVITGKKKVIDEIKKVAKESEIVYLAPDPDREGEAIAWHVSEVIEGIKSHPPIKRVLFNEITKNAVREAIEHPVELNRNMFEAQQARRILDRLVGYQISPLLWDKVRRGLSAGRVQSVAVRLVCEREEEIKAFKPEEYWSLEVRLEGSKKPEFVAHLAKKNGNKIEVKSGDEANKIVSYLKNQFFHLAQIQKKEQKRHPTAPFITSKLQQEASRKLGFTAKKTMMLAQRLYEGIELDEGPAGLITYMRTDSTRIAPTAIEEVRQYIVNAYGKNYLPEQPNVYKTKKTAQDAHEAIRPTSMQYTPDKVKKYLERDAFRLYELIWKRFVASQMVSAVLDQTVFIINGGDYQFRSSGSVIKFDGFISVYTEDKDDDGVSAKSGDEENEEGGLLPELKEGETLACHEFLPSQHFTQAPPRYTEASLVKILEEKGIGRPSTYASIISVIQEKKYAEKNDQKKFLPTSLGVIVNDLLVKNFPDVLDVTFTAKMEDELDSVEEGTMKWTDSLSDFYKTFSKTLAKAKVQMKDVKRQEIPTDIACDKCGSVMVIKFGRNGEFLACQSYPECKNTKEFKKTPEGKIEIVKQEVTNEICDKCSSPMIVKTGRYGKFLACSKYPQCKNAKPIPLGVNCPKCGKALTQKKSKRGRLFYGCTAYPNCDFATWDKPVNQTCPQCRHPYLFEKVTQSRGTELKCPNKECGYSKMVDG